MLKMLNNKINKNGGIYIANKGLEQMYSLERTFLWAIVLQTYLYINIYKDLFVGLYITGNLANRKLNKGFKVIAFYK